LEQNFAKNQPTKSPTTFPKGFLKIKMWILPKWFFKSLMSLLAHWDIEKCNKKRKTLNSQITKWLIVEMGKLLTFTHGKGEEAT
jgi:hypothetical protein